MPDLDTTFSALADPTRRAIIAHLAKDGEVTAGELAAPFAMSAPAISRHLKVLETARLIDRKTDAQFRRLSLNPEGFQAAADWLDEYRKYWEDQLGALADYLNEIQQPGDRNDGNGEKSRPPKRTSGGRPKRRG
ncbi:MAG: metalloregulator ArsR/SmtB family transcription factor [Rhodospirillaceae bacterium]